MMSQIVSLGVGYLIGSRVGSNTKNNTSSENSSANNVLPNTSGVEDSNSSVSSLERLDRLIRLNHFNQPLNNRVIYGGHFPLLINFFCIEDCTLKLDLDLSPMIISQDEYSIRLLGGSTISCTLPDRLSLEDLVCGNECAISSTTISDVARWPDLVEQSMGLGTYQANIVVQGPLTSAFICALKWKGSKVQSTYPISQGVVYVQQGLVSGHWSKYMKEPTSEFAYLVDDRSGYEIM